MAIIIKHFQDSLLYNNQRNPSFQKVNRESIQVTWPLLHLQKEWLKTRWKERKAGPPVAKIGNFFILLWPLIILETIIRLSLTIFFLKARYPTMDNCPMEAIRIRGATIKQVCRNQGSRQVNQQDSEMKNKGKTITTAVRLVQNLIVNPWKNDYISFCVCKSVFF